MHPLHSRVFKKYTGAPSPSGAAPPAAGSRVAGPPPCRVEPRGPHRGHGIGHRGLLDRLLRTAFPRTHRRNGLGSQLRRRAARDRVAGLRSGALLLEYRRKRVVYQRLPLAPPSGTKAVLLDWELLSTPETNWTYIHTIQIPALWTQM